MLKGSTNAIKKIFEFIAEQSGCTLFHCVAGKDRTGVLAMLLLGLAGVDKPDIIANYEVTRTYLSEKMTTQEATAQYPLELMESRREYMKPAIEYIFTTFNNVENYLKHIGISTETLTKVKSKLA